MAVNSGRTYEDANDLLKDRADCLRIETVKKDGSWHVVLVLDGGYSTKSGIPGFCADDAAEYFRRHIGEMLAETVGAERLHNWKS
jgi:hypothetical protein